MDIDELVTFSTSQKSGDMHQTRFDDSPQMIMSHDKVNFGGVDARRFNGLEGTMKPSSVSKLNANHLDDAGYLPCKHSMHC